MSKENLNIGGKKRQLCSCTKCYLKCSELLQSTVESSAKRKCVENLSNKDTGLLNCNNVEYRAEKLDQEEDNQDSWVSEDEASSQTSQDEDTYNDVRTEIKKSESQNTDYGNNMFNRNEKKERKGPRPVVVDGSNVAFGHSNGKFFSCKGLKICADFFLQRNHKLYIIVPHYRQCGGQAKDQDILRDLHRQGHVYFTPSRMVDGRLEVPYDDRYIVQLAAANGGVIVSSDRFRDLIKEDQRWADTIKNRLLMYTWIDNILFFPKDPFGKHGPSLDELLQF